MFWFPLLLRYSTLATATEGRQGYFGSQLRVQLTMAEESSQQDTEKAGHITSTVQKQRVGGHVCAPLLYSQRSQPGKGAIHGWAISPQLA